MLHLASFGMRPISRKDVRGKTTEIKRSAAAILEEVAREVGCSPHIESPGLPVVLYGDGPLALIAALKTEFEAARDKRGRRPHADTNVLLGIIVSYPVPPVEIMRDQAEWIDYQAWEIDVLSYAKGRFGQCFRCAVRHVDETYWHVHMFVTPDWAAGHTNLHCVHPAMQAFISAAPKESKKGRTLKIRRNAWTQALRQFQDDFYEAVSVKHGHARIGPRRGRITQRDMRREQQREWAYAVVREKAAEILREVDLRYAETLRELAAAQKSRVELDALVNRLRDELERAACEGREVSETAKVALGSIAELKFVGPEGEP